MDLVKVLQIIRPNGGWTLQGTEYTGLIWHGGDGKGEKPTLEECTAGWATYLAEHAYKEKRQVEYPPIGDQLDALWTGGKAAQDMKATIDAVKTKYPKG